MFELVSTDSEYKAATALQYRGLHLIREIPGITVGELAKNCMMSSAAVAQFLERLVKTGWVEKKTDTRDKRVSHLSLTSAGKKQLQELNQKMTKKLEGMLSLISEEDFNHLLRIQKTLLQNLEKKQNAEAV